MAVKGAKTKRTTAAQVQAVEALEAVRDVSFDSVTGEIQQVQVEVQKTLAELSGKLTEKLNILEDVQKAINVKKDEMRRLQQIEADALELDELKAQIEMMKEEQKDQEAEWKRNFEEQKSDERKKWAREEAEHIYTTEQKRRKMEDTLTWDIAQKEKANREKQEQLEKNWTEREALMKKGEQELAELRLYKEGEKDRIQKEVNAAVAVANNSLKKEYEHQKQIALKDAEMQMKLAEQTAASDKHKIERLEAQIVDLNNKLEQAVQRMTDISTKALDSASGRDKAEALQRLMESDKMSSKTSK